MCIGLEHLPNIYCGVAVFLLYPLYIFNRKISAREKIAKSVLLFVFIFAFSFNIPNFIWHGFHYPNSLPARQSFVYIFILLTMCFDAYKDMKDYSTSQLAKAFGLFLIYLLWLDHSGGDNDPEYGVLFVNAFFMLLYVIVALLYKKDKLKIHFIVFLLFCVSCIECTMNMEETGYSTTGRSAYFKDYDSVKTLTTELSESDDTFYRIAKAFGYRSKNDAAWHNFNSASTFSSTAYAGVTELFGRLGLEHSMNAYADHGATPLVYSMFDIKYILSNKQINDDYTLELVDIVRCPRESGPRIIRFSDDGKFAYILFELSNEIRAYKYDGSGKVPTFELIQTIETSAKKDVHDTHNAASGLSLANDGKHLFCTTAGEDTVSMFERDEETGMLTRKFTLPISGEYPKDLVLLPDDKHLVLANHASNTLTTFTVDYEKNIIVMNGKPIKITEPNCIRIWLVPEE